MAQLDTDIVFEYDMGDSTEIDVSHCTGWRTLPWSVCVCPVDSVVKVEYENRVAYYVGAPDALITSRNVPHRLTVVEGIRPVSIWCHFRIDISHGLDLLQFYRIPDSFTGDCAREIRREVLALNAVYLENVSPDILFRRHYHGFNLVKQILTQSEPRTDVEQLITSYFRLSPALSLMRERIGSGELMLGEAAAAVNLSPSRFSGLFRQTLGIAPLAYFNRLRIQKAQEMLLKTGLSVGEIAEELKFFDAYHFSHKFKRLTGVSPKEYRSRILRSLYPGGEKPF